MQEIRAQIHQVVKDLFNVDETVELSRTDEQFGDFASNVALHLSKKLSQNPREIAQKIADSLKDSKILKTEVAGSGFINIALSDETLIKLTEQKISPSGKSTVVIETNNPNPFKAMHIGHAFNAVLGDTLANLIEASGAHVHRVSYHGDVGLHVGKSMYSLLKFVSGDPGKLAKVQPAERNSFMSKMYSEGSMAYKDDETAKKTIDELAKQSFIREDRVYAEVYETCLKWSFEQIDEIVSILGNKPIERRFLESEADQRGVEIVKKNTPKIFKESDGALIFEGSKYGSFDNVFVGSNGNGLYGARDLGLMQLKNEQYHPNKSYVVTGGEQAAYFKGVLAAAALIWPDQGSVTVNIPTGLVKLTTGKMSSRTGEVVEIAWLFEQFRQAIVKRDGEPKNEIIAGALRYQFLKVKIGGDVVFDVNEAVSLSGNTGSYLQYAHARASSILAKRPTIQGWTTKQDPSLKEKLERGERSLVRKIGEFNEVIERATTELMPHYICTYLYELAQEFNRFYEQNHVLGDEREDLRMNLVHKYAQTLAVGLNLLGIHAPDKM